MAEVVTTKLEQKLRAKRAENLHTAAFTLEMLGVEPTMARRLHKLAEDCRTGKLVPQ